MKPQGVAGMEPLSRDLGSAYRSRRFHSSKQARLHGKRIAFSLGLVSISPIEQPRANAQNLSEFLAITGTS